MYHKVVHPGEYTSDIVVYSNSWSCRLILAVIADKVYIYRFSGDSHIYKHTYVRSYNAHMLQTSYQEKSFLFNQSLNKGYIHDSWFPVAMPSPHTAETQTYPIRY